MGEDNDTDALRLLVPLLQVLKFVEYGSMEHANANKDFGIYGCSFQQTIRSTST